MFAAGKQASITGLICGAAIALMAATGQPAAADEVAEFYKGKRITVTIGYSPGGEYDLHARLVARHIGRHVPGNPSVVPQNNPGAGGLRNVNFIYEAAPRDGTHIGMMSNNTPMAELMGLKGTDYDSTAFHWIGAIAPTVETVAIWHTAPATSLEAARSTPLKAGATSRGSATYIFPTLLNHFAGTKFEIVTGYQGGSGVNLAMERGEVHARNNTWSSWKTTKTQWLQDKKVIVIVQAGPRAPDLDAPSLEDFAKTDDDRKIISLLASGTQLGRPLATAPKVPADRVAALRAAFRATMEDSEFRKDAAKSSVEIDPVRGEDMQALVAGLKTIPEPLIKRAVDILDW